MAARRSVAGLVEAMGGLSLAPAPAGRLACLSSSRSPCTPSQARTFSTTRATAAPLATPATHTASAVSAAPGSAAPGSTASTASSVTSIADRTVPVTVYAFPSLEPRGLSMYAAQHLHLPLRRDLLHLAVVYEGDNTRQGTASTKTRFEVHGSHRKMRRQKGSGMARIGTRQSPLLRGGGKTFGPKPRDFGTGLNRKMYDRAWRTALSYRYRRGELVVVEDGMELPLPDAFLRLAADGTLDPALEDGFVQRYVRTLLNGVEHDLLSPADVADANARSPVGGLVARTSSGVGSIGQAWGRLAGRSTFVTTSHRPNLFSSLDVAGQDARALLVDDVDVKDLLETGRIVVEKDALRAMLERHQSDLVSRVFVQGMRPNGPAIGAPVV